MDVFAIVFGSIGAVTGIGALAVAILGERRASKSAKSAANSAQSAERAAAALEHSNAFAESQAQPDNAKIGDAIWVFGDLFQIKNETGRSIQIEQLLAVPSERIALLRPKHALPQEVGPNETFEFYAESRVSLARPDVQLMWRWSDEDETHTTNRMVAARE